MDSKIEGLELGADDYLSKPFEEKELRARVKNLIEQRRQLREYMRKELDFNPANIAVNSIDEQFLQRVYKLIDQHIDDTEYSVDRFSYDDIYRFHKFNTRRDHRSCKDRWSWLFHNGI